VALGLHTSVAPDNAVLISPGSLISSLRIPLCALPVFIVQLRTPDSGDDQFCCLPKRIILRIIIGAERRLSPLLSPLVIVVHQYMCMPVEACLICVPALHSIGINSGIVITEGIKIRGVII
jgi:hypothetical protein